MSRKSRVIIWLIPITVAISYLLLNREMRPVLTPKQAMPTSSEIVLIPLSLVAGAVGTIALFCELLVWIIGLFSYGVWKRDA